MRLKVPGVAPGIDGEARAAGIAGLRQRVAHGHAAGAVARLVEVLLGEQADERPAAHEVEEVPFLVAEGGHVDAEPGHCRVCRERSRRLARVDDAERAVEPAGMVLRLDVRAGEHFSPGRAAKTQYVADAVDV